MNRKTILFILVMLMTGTVMAQDVITLKNGDEINGKVTKVSSTEIEYKLASNPDGPTYTKPVAEIFMVKYANGQKDVFNNTPAPAAQQQVTVDIPTGVTLERSGGEIVNAATGKAYSDFELQQMLGMEAFQDYEKARESYKSTNGGLASAYTFFALGPLMYWAGVALEDGSNNGLACRVIGYVWTIGGNIMIPVTHITRGVAAGKISHIAEGYNDKNSSLSMNLSGGFTLLTSAEGGVAPGVGLTLSF